MAALQRELSAKVKMGELVHLVLPSTGVAGLAGLFADDPALREICDDIYRQRDADPAA